MSDNKKIIDNLKLIKQLLCFLFGIFCPEPEPDQDSKSEPEKVKVEVCIHSGQLPRKFCLHRETREFIEGEEPTQRCEKHNFRKSKRREEMMASNLGFFLCFLREWWKKKNRIQAEEDALEVLAEQAKRDIAYSKFFLWLCDNKREHKPLNNKTPYRQRRKFWVLGKRTFDLMKKTPKFFKAFDRFIYLHSLFNIVPLPKLEMDRYNDYPYSHNKNGIKARVTSLESLPFQINLANWTADVLEKHFNERWKFEFVNEPMHYGSDEIWHRVALWHRVLFDEFLRKRFETKQKALRHLFIDLSHSEAGQLLLTWHSGDENDQRCPKCGRLLKDIFGITTERWMARLRVGEHHWASLVDDMEHGHNSVIKHFASANDDVCWDEDCGTHFVDKAKGFRPPWGEKRAWADAKQYGETCDYVWGIQTAKPSHLRKRNYMSIFPAETIERKNGIFYERYRKDKIDWARFDAMLTSHIRHFGE